MGRVVGLVPAIRVDAQAKQLPYMNHIVAPYVETPLRISGGRWNGPAWMTGTSPVMTERAGPEHHPVPLSIPQRLQEMEDRADRVAQRMRDARPTLDRDRQILALEEHVIECVGRGRELMFARLLGFGGAGGEQRGLRGRGGDILG